MNWCKKDNLTVSASKTVILLSTCKRKGLVRCFLQSNNESVAIPSTAKTLEGLSGQQDVWNDHLGPKECSQ